MDRSHPLILLFAGCAEDGPPEAAVPILATEVVSAPGATGEGFFDADLATNGVRGGGRFHGGLDVFSVRFDDELVLGFPEPIFDTDGPDLAVFENPFDIETGGRFFDPVLVALSPDCERFVPFPAEYLGDPDVWTADPSLWTGFAGITPVLMHEDDNPVDPMSDDAGGDRFDLADLDADDPLVAELLQGGLVCVRLTAAPGPSDPLSNGPDIDGVYAAAP